jgi:DNA-binding GntR family transcriptional regulator
LKRDNSTKWTMKPREEANIEAAQRGFGVTTVRRQLEDALRQAIIEGHFPPGPHLSDRVLQDTYSVSRTVVREAVRQLEAEGLVETQAYRGSFVREISVDEARQIYDVRCVLEAFAASGFAKNATEAQIDRLDAVLNRMREQVANPDSRALIRLKQDFYAILLEGCGNDYVSKMLNTLLNQNTQLRRTSLSAPNRLSATINELGNLILAFRQRDGDAAWAATVLHVRNAANIAISILSRGEGEGEAVPEADLNAAAI